MAVTYAETCQVLAIGFGRWTRERVLAPIVGGTPSPLTVTAVTSLLEGESEYRQVIEPYFSASSLSAPKYISRLDDALDALKGTHSRPAAVISTPNAFHAAQVSACLERGYDVYVERPLATRLEDARRLARQAKDRGLRLFTGTQRRTEATYAYVHDAVAGRKDFGQLSTIRCSLSVGERPEGWRLSRSLAGGGVLIDSGFHLLDGAAWIAADAGHDLSAISGISANGIWYDTSPSSKSDSVEHSAWGSVSFTSGLQLIFDFTYTAPDGSVYEYLDARDKDGARISILRNQSRKSRSPGRITHQRADGSVVTLQGSGTPMPLDNAYLQGTANESGPLDAMLASRSQAIGAPEHACAASRALPTFELTEAIYSELKQ